MSATGGAFSSYSVTSGQSGDRLLALCLTIGLFVFCVAARDPAWWPVFVASGLLIGFFQWRLYVRDGLTLAGVALMAIGARLLLFNVPPVLSDDIYRYIWDGILVVDGINPYAFVPSSDELEAYRSLPIFAHLNSRDFYSVYPPVSQLVFAVGGLVARPDWMTGYYVIKGVIVALECTGLILLARTIPRRQTMLLALHPIILLAGAAQGHTDGMLVFFIGGAFIAWQRGRQLLAVVLVTLAGWVKLVPLLFIPLLLRRRPVAASVTAVITTALISIPFLEGYVFPHVAQSLDLYVRYFEFYAGPYYGLKQLLLEWTGDDWSKQLGPAFRTTFLLVLAGTYVVHLRWRTDPWRTALWISGAYLLLTTTIHPWYFTSILILIAVCGRYAAHWQWVALWSIGTYLLYVGGPYWIFVIVGWTGFGLILLLHGPSRLIDTLLSFRAEDKVRSVEDWLSDLGEQSTALDLGAGEGHVGRVVADKTGADVTLADIEPSSRHPDLKQIVYDGVVLPAADDTYDTVLLIFVLHHAADSEQVLREAVRVSRGHVIVVESVHRGAEEKKRFERIDRTVNRLRPGRSHSAFESHLDMRAAEEWEQMIERSGGRILDRRDRYRPWHRQALWLISV